jgi:predicted ArsR family transcriptional regulator
MRAEVLRQLRDLGRPMPVAEIATAVGLHPNTTRFHLDALTDQGLVTRAFEQRNQPGRPKALYQAVPGHRGDHYHDLAAALVQHFAGGLDDRQERARAAGRAWGDRLRAEWDPQDAMPPVDRLVSCMADLGYQPDYIEDPEPTVVLRPCPFLDLVAEGRDVICELHVGIARGLLGPDDSWQVAGIEPLVTPHTCLLHLVRSEAAPADDGEDPGADDA